MLDNVCGNDRSHDDGEDAVYVLWNSAYSGDHVRCARDVALCCRDDMVLHACVVQIYDFLCVEVKVGACPGGCASLCDQSASAGRLYLFLIFRVSTAFVPVAVALFGGHRIFAFAALLKGLFLTGRWERVLRVKIVFVRPYLAFCLPVTGLAGDRY